MKENSQAARLLKLLSDGEEHLTNEIRKIVYGRNQPELGEHQSPHR